jgi:hypothetical protein
MLYEDADLQRKDEHGRRLYLREEFDLNNGHHATEEVHLSMVANRKLVRDDVFALTGGASVALSKLDFAQRVLGGGGEFDGINFEGSAPPSRLSRRLRREPQGHMASTKPRSPGN